MEGTYPVIIDGELAGKLKVGRQGALTEFLAETRDLPGIVRISVYGGGKEGYLGVLAPSGDGLALRKTVSPGGMREFPEQIDSVERSGLLEEHLRAIAQDAAAETEPAPAPMQPEALMEPTAEPPHGKTPDEPTEERASEAAEELPADENDDELFWYSSPDGALVRFDGEQNLIALPLGDPRIPKGGGGQPRQVEGREYLVFRTKNGRLLR